MKQRRAKHRTPSTPDEPGKSTVAPPGDGNRWLTALRDRLHRPAMLAGAAVLAVATGGVATWQLASADTPASARAQSSHPAVAWSSGDEGDNRDRDRAARGAERQDVLSASPTPSPTHSSAPTAANSTAAKAPPPKAPQPPAVTPAPKTSVTRTTAPPAPAPAPTKAPTGQYVPIGPSFSGEASFYGGGDGTDGGPTASGEVFDANALTAASPDLPFNTLVQVCYQGSCVVVRINDRGPYTGGRIIDLSAAAARVIGMEDAGIGYVTVTPVRKAT